MRPGDTRYARWARSFESVTRATEDLSPFLRFSREEWSRLRAAAPLTLTEEDLSSLRGLNEKVSLEDIVGRPRNVPLDSDTIVTARELGISLGD